MDEEDPEGSVSSLQSSNKKTHKWSDVVRDFTERTTFHGLRYITEDTRYISRRISWVLIVLTIIGVFSYAIISRVLLFYQRPVYIDLQVGYMDEVDFPAVTVCNQNPYRLSTLQKNGMYEVIREAYTIQKSGNLPVELTISTCKELCTNYASSTCSGFLYELQTRSCTLTSYTGEDKGWYTEEDIIEAKTRCSNSMVYFYRRIRCHEGSDIYCSFEDGDGSIESIRTEKCRFDHDGSLPSTWTIRKGQDSTFGTEYGHFLQLFQSDSYTKTIARIQTDLLDTTSKCIMLAARVNPSEEISIKVLKESLESTTLLSTQTRQTEDFKWIWLYAKLPNGFHRVIIEGSKTEIRQFQLKIDDLVILPCAELRRNCTRNPQGTFYLSDMYTSQNGPNCTDAGIFDEYYADYHCGAYLDYPRNIPRCVCSETDFTCSDGLCISSTLTCNQVADCIDGSDESKHLCGVKDTVTCNFDDEYLCGYSNVTVHKSIWKRHYYPSLDDRNGNGYLLQLDTGEDSLLQGKSTLISTPLRSFPDNTLVMLSIKSLLHPEDNGIAIHLYGTLGLSTHPVLIHGLSKVKRRTYSLDETDGLVQSRTTYGGRTKYGLCVPGGPGVQHSLIFQAALTREDNFAIENVNATGVSCNVSQGQGDQTFSKESTLNCSFQSDICGYSVLREHLQVSLAFVPLSNLENIQQMSEWINGNAKRLVTYKNKDYNKIFFESPGYIECGAGCYDGWLIVSPDDMKIKIDVISIVPVTYSCIMVIPFGAWFGDKLCDTDTTFVSDGNELQIYADASQVQFQLRYEFITPDNHPVDSALAFIYTGQYSQERAYFHLYSPPVKFTTTSCLTFTYLRRSPIKVARLSSFGVETILFEDSVVSTRMEQFVHMVITVKGTGNDSSIVTFQGQKTQSGLPHYSLILKYIYSHDMSCIDYSLQHQNELELKGKRITGSCGFDDEDQCGYMDMSWSPIKWVRDTVLDEHGKLRHVMRYGSSSSLDDLSRILLSPLLSVTDNSCIHLTIGANANPKYFFWRSSLTVFIRLESTYEIQPFQQFYVTSNFGNYELELPVGEYRFIFQPKILQDGLNIYIDEIEILSPCYSETTAGSPRTTSSYSTDEIPTLASEGTTVLTDEGFPYTSLGPTPTVSSESEMYLELTSEFGSTEFTTDTSATKSSTSDPILMIKKRDIASGDLDFTNASVTADREPVTTTQTVENREHSVMTEISDLYLSEEEAKVYLIDKLDQMNFSEILSHRTDEFLISCIWNGKLCNGSLITTTETDMGTCISFNAEAVDGEHVAVDKPGPLHGLQIILNIEKYEDVENTGTNSGVKIHFYPTDDVPVMQSNGYFVSPGTHVLFNLKYTNSSFLEPEYGTCGRKELSFFSGEEYSHSRCQLQCARDSLWMDCHCYLPHMSANIDDQCRISDYLDCVLPRKTSAVNKCDCPDACDQVAYESQFSTSTFSDEAVATLLLNKENAILQNYRTSLSMRERVRHGTFPELYSQIYDMNTANKAFLSLLNQDSVVGVVAEALKNLSVAAMSDYEAAVRHYGQKLQQSTTNCSMCDNQWSDIKDQLRSSDISAVRTSTKYLDDIHNWYGLWLNKGAVDLVEVYELAEHLTDQQEPFSLYSVINIVALLRSHLQQNVIQNMKTIIENTAAGVIAFYNKVIDTLESCPCVAEVMDVRDGYTKSFDILRQPRYDFQDETTHYTSTEEVLLMSAEFSRTQFQLELTHHIDQVIRQYSADLTSQLDDYFTKYQQQESNYLTSVDKVTSTMEKHKERSKLDTTFIKNNIIQVDAYFGDLKYSQTAQKVEYGVGDFFSDLGGFLGLLLGASVVTVVEVLDLIIYHILRRHSTHKDMARSPTQKGQMSIRMANRDTDNKIMEGNTDIVGNVYEDVDKGGPCHVTTSGEIQNQTRKSTEYESEGSEDNAPTTGMQENSAAGSDRENDNPTIPEMEKNEIASVGDISFSEMPIESSIQTKNM